MVTDKKRRLYVEGGGDGNSALASECREAFSELFKKAGITKKPAVTACGGRKRAYDLFCEAHELGVDDVWLLVDAEDVVSSSGSNFNPWDHVKHRVGDGWDRPHGAADEQLHLMNVTMETWLLADRAALIEVLGERLNVAKLPPEGASLETKSKKAVYDALSAATKSTPSHSYAKGSHSFKILANVSPVKLRQLPWARRFLDEMSK